MLAVVGDSASGKTTLTEGIADILGRDRVTHVCTDDYHKYDRAERAQLGMTPLHPDCNYLDVLEAHLDCLRRGLPILKPVYDHSDGSLLRPEYVRPRRFVIVEGLLGFHAARLRECFDVKVYLDPPEVLRRVWKVKRDTAKRGYTADQVLAELERREKDSAQFIRPQRAFADIVVRFFPERDVAPDKANGHLNVHLVLRPTIPHPDLTDVLDQPATRAGSGIRLELGRDDGLPVDFLEVNGQVSPQEAADLEAAIWKHMPETTHLRPDLIGAYADGNVRRHSDPLALTQLLITYHLLRAAHAED
jgi:phosphoribulokinase